MIRQNIFSNAKDISKFVCILLRNSDLIFYINLTRYNLFHGRNSWRSIKLSSSQICLDETFNQCSSNTARKFVGKIQEKI